MKTLKSEQKFKVQNSTMIESMFNDPESDVINFSGFHSSTSKGKSSEALLLDVLLEDVDPVEINFKGFEHSHNPQHLPTKEADIFDDDIEDASGFIGFQLITQTTNSKSAAKWMTTNLMNGHDHCLNQVSNVDDVASKDCSVRVQRMPKATEELLFEQKKVKWSCACNRYISRHCLLHSNNVRNETVKKIGRKNCESEDQNFVDDTKILNSQIKSAGFPNNCEKKEKSHGTHFKFKSSLKLPIKKTSEAKSSGKSQCSFSHKSIILVNITSDMNSIYKICDTFNQFGVLSAIKLFDKSDNQLYNLDNSFKCALIKFEKSEDALTAFTEFTHKETSLHLVKEGTNFIAESILFPSI